MTDSENSVGQSSKKYKIIIIVLLLIFVIVVAVLIQRNSSNKNVDEELELKQKYISLLKNIKDELKKNKCRINKNKSGINKNKSGINKDKSGINISESMSEENESISNLNEMCFNKNEKVIDKNRSKINKNEEIINKNEEIINKNEKAIDKNEKVIDRNEKVIDKNEKVIDKNEKVIDKNESKINKNESVFNKKESVFNKKDGVFNKKESLVNKNKFETESETSKKVFIKNEEDRPNKGNIESETVKRRNWDERVINKNRNKNIKLDSGNVDSFKTIDDDNTRKHKTTNYETNNKNRKKEFINPSDNISPVLTNQRRQEDASKLNQTNENFSKYTSVDGGDDKSKEINPTIDRNIKKRGFTITDILKMYNMDQYNQLNQITELAQFWKNNYTDNVDLEIIKLLISVSTKKLILEFDSSEKQISLEIQEKIYNKTEIDENTIIKIDSINAVTYDTCINFYNFWNDEVSDYFYETLKSKTYNTKKNEYIYICLKSFMCTMINQLIDYRDIFKKETGPSFLSNIQEVIDKSISAYMTLEKDYVNGKDSIRKIILAVIESDLLNCFYTSTSIFIKYFFDMCNQFFILKNNNITFLEFAKYVKLDGFDAINESFDAKNLDILGLIKVFFKIKILQLNYICNLRFEKLESSREDLLKDYVLKHNELIRSLNIYHDDLLYFVYMIKHFYEEEK